MTVVFLRLYYHGGDRFFYAYYMVYYQICSCFCLSRSGSQLSADQGFDSFQMGV